MPQVRIECFCTRCTEKYRPEYPESAGIMGKQPKGIVGIQRIDYREVIGDVVGANGAYGGEP